MKKLVRLFGCMIAIFLVAAPTIAEEKVFFYHTDPAGTPLAMTDSSGNVVWRADYKPFGEEQSVTQSPENVMKFVGKEKDKETGLHYFGARYMKDEIGRFITSDPVEPVDPKTSKTNNEMLKNPQKMNRYAYALNNPYKYVDPLGLFDITIVEMGERNGPTYDAKIKVIGDNGKVAEVRGSAWPNPSNPSPGITEGTYDATYSTTGHKGITNGVRLEDGGKIPTLGPNPTQNNQEYATGINIHAGYSETNRGSAGCITIDPKQANKVWSVLQNGETGTVTINRKPEAEE
jgi:RHS repeat-associated protein